MEHNPITKETSKYKRGVVKEKDPTKPQHTDGHHVIIGCREGTVYEYSIKHRKIIKRFGKVVPRDVWCMAKTTDNRYLFVCEMYNHFKTIDLRTYKEVNLFNVDEASWAIVSYDNKFLFTALLDRKIITKWSIETKEKLDEWKLEENVDICSLHYSYNNKDLIIGWEKGYVSVLDMNKGSITKKIKPLDNEIWSFAQSKDGNKIFVSDYNGQLVMLQEKNEDTKPTLKKKLNFIAKFVKKIIDPDTPNYYPYKIEKPKIKAGHSMNAIVLTPSEEEIIAGNNEFTVQIINVKEWTHTKTIKLPLPDIELDHSRFVELMVVIDDGKKLLIPEGGGYLSIMDLETKEITETMRPEIGNDYAWTICVI